MIWLTWRQFRTQAAVAAALLVAVAVATALNSHLLGDLWNNSGAAACTAAGNCTDEVGNFLDRANAGLIATLFNLSSIFMYALPPLIGVFWGAPLIARELESGTHRLVWNQSVTPQRWLAVKLGTLGLASIAATALFSTLVTWAARRPDQAAMDRITPEFFSARGVAPVAYTAFAFALGVTAGLLLRRTVPAMAATLGVYIAALLGVGLGVRAHLLPARHLTTALTADSIKGFGMNRNGSDVQVFAGHDGISGWTLSNTTTDASGHTFHGPADMSVCGRDAGTPKECLNWLASQHLQHNVSYLPESRFWALQFAESGIFVAAALLLVGFTFWWLRRRTA
jgi:ABC-2 family transporter protein